MADLIPIAGHDLALFLGASVAMLLTPGPAVLYVTGIALDRGTRAGLLSVLGVNIGGLAQLVLTVTGLTLVLKGIPGALKVITLLGAAYLIYLGIDRLRKPALYDIPHEDRRKALAKIFVDGVVVSLLNPKSALFMIAFLPQFITPGAGAEWLQLITLGVMFAALALVTDSGYVLAAGAVRKLVQHRTTFKALQKYFGGGIFILLGILLAASELF